MKFVASLTAIQQGALTQLYQSAKTHRTRQRAQAILLSSKGHSIAQLAEIFSVDRDTLSRWIDTWNKAGLDGLSDAPKSGRPSKVDAELEAVLRDLLAHPTPALKAAVEDELQKKTLRSLGRR